MNIDYSRLITPEAREAAAEAALRAARLVTAEAYLAATDWYVTRFAEIGTPIPEDVLAERKAARSCFD